MDENITIAKDEPTRLQNAGAPSIADLVKPKFEGNSRKKRRRGKSNRKLMRPLSKVPWQARKNEQPKRNHRYRKIVLAKTHAPFNNNQFLMEIHKPEPENNFQMRTPSARTRDSSFSVDSDDNYLYSLPEDEDEYLTKEFSSVYEDAQSERLTNMSKNELIQEYLLLEAKYDNLVKRTERYRCKPVEEDATTDRETSMTDMDSMVTDRDTSGTSVDSSTADEPTYCDILQKMKEQEDQIRELQLTNEKLRLENEHLHQRSHGSSSEDSESDSSSTSDSDSSSCSSVDEPVQTNCVHNGNGIHVNGQNGETEDLDADVPMVNGFHSPKE